MSAYIVFMREKTLNQSELEAYWSKVQSTMQGYSLKVLAAYGRHQTLEGPDVEGVVIAEFPTLEEAREWYDSPAYQEAAKHRFHGAVYRGLIVDGV
ncbi:DUF1330 domain-containing protein [Schlesneria paludicola]|uniref:DUF1330 domain-containing protein n=1 Tax=Schlesneria paludicola TaxID=360056 RepID=UPI000299CFD5|nr:DUF1330 domain-containing protein [Schlesneria paludicola]